MNSLCVYGEKGSVDCRDTGELEHVILLVAFKVIFVLYITSTTCTFRLYSTYAYAKMVI